MIGLHRSPNAKRECTRKSRSICRPVSWSYRSDPRPGRRRALRSLYLCAVACPVGCISLQKAETKTVAGTRNFSASTSHAAFSVVVRRSLSDHGDSVNPGFRNGEYKRQDLVYEKEDLLISGPGNTRNITSTGWQVWQSTAKIRRSRERSQAYRRQEPVTVRRGQWSSLFISVA